MVRVTITLVTLLTISTAASALVLRVPEPAVAPTDIRLPALKVLAIAPAPVEPMVETRFAPTAEAPTTARVEPQRCRTRPLAASWRRSAYRPA